MKKDGGAISSLWKVKQEESSRSLQETQDVQKQEKDWPGLLPPCYCKQERKTSSSPSGLKQEKDFNDVLEFKISVGKIL